MLDSKLTRRHFVTLSSGAVAAALVRVKTAKAAAPNLVAYHDSTLADHEAFYRFVNPLGYRPLSVSIYGTVAAPLYAAIWDWRTGPAWAMSSNLDAAGLASLINLCNVYRFGMPQLSATGPANNPRFVAVIEQLTNTEPLQIVKYDLRSGSAGSTTIGNWLNWAYNGKQIPRALAVYGTAADPRYAVSFGPNTDGVLWNADGLNETALQYRNRFIAQGENRGRPFLVPVSPEARYSQLFLGNELTNGWVAKNAMTSAGYEDEYQFQLSRGYYPIQVSGGGSGASTRFSALFVSSETIKPRVLTKTGNNGSNRLPALDAEMENIMVNQRVRQAMLAVVKDRKLVYARAFTRAEAGYPIAQPTTYFRMASCSKTITAMLVLRIIQEGRLKLGDKLQTVLNLRQPNGKLPAAPLFGNITIEMLLRHRSGVPGAPSPQETANQYGASLPVTKAQTAGSIAALPLLFDPNAEYRYSNEGMFLLGMVIEKVLGTTYMNALISRILRPLGALRFRLFAELPEAQQLDEAKYDSSKLEVGPTVVAGDGRIVPKVYGGDFDTRVWDSDGGLSIAAPDFAKVLANLNVRKDNVVLNPTNIDLMLIDGIGFDGVKAAAPIQVWKGGSIWGQSSTVFFEKGGATFVVCCNKDGVGLPDFSALAPLVAGAAWPAADLFPTFGIPSF